MPPVPRRRYDARDWLHDAFGLGLSGPGYRQNLPLRKHAWWTYVVAVLEIPVAVVLVWLLHAWQRTWLRTSIAMLLIVSVCSSLSPRRSP